MGDYVGLDVSLEETAICVLGSDGRVCFEGKTATTPEALYEILRRRAPDALRIGLEAGPLSGWLVTELGRQGIAVVCMEARHAHGALSMRPAKTDRNDARGLAELVRMGWFKAVHVKSGESRLIRAELAARAQLVKARTDLDGQIRGLLRSFGLKVGQASGKAFSRRVDELVREQEGLQAIMAPLLVVRAALMKQIEGFDSRLRKRAKALPACRRLMTVPGAGVLTSMAYLAALDDLTRFSSSADPGAYFGLTPRRYQSGEVDRTGGISKCGDSMVRRYLFEAANVLLSRVTRWSALKAWAVRLAKRVGLKKAKVALARKLAVVMFAILRDGSEFQWGQAKVA
jgi:transposase